MQQFKFTATILHGKHMRTLDGCMEADREMSMDTALQTVAAILRKEDYAGADSLRLHLRLSNKPAPAVLPN